MTDSPLRLLLEFDAHSQRDKDQSPVFLHRRDRKFALVCEQQGVAPDARRWLDHMAHLSGGPRPSSPADRPLRLWRRINAGFITAGVLSGVIAMLGLLFYDGGQRINITVFLAFVALQLLLALLTTAQSLAGWQPWRPLLRRLHAGSSTDLGGKLQPVLMARAAHLGGLCFTLTALLTLLTMVVVRDLAFGWSTTLDTAAARYHQLILFVATPWQWLWPEAVPDLALVEATRFYRVASGDAGGSVQQWGQWWPFVTMLWLTWAVLPRAVLTLISVGLLRRTCRRLLARHPGMQALLYRLETPLLETGNEHNDAADMPDTSTRLALKPLPESRILLCWAGAGEPEPPGLLAGDSTRTYRAGGRASLAEDREVIRRISTELATGATRSVLMATRSWEPPTGELQDFLESARELWPGGTCLTLVPVSAQADRQAQAHQISQWLRFAERVGTDFVGVSVPPVTRQDAVAEPEDRA